VYVDGEEHKGSGVGYRAAIPGLQQTASYTRQDVRSVPGALFKTLIFWVALGAAGHLKKFRDSPQGVIRKQRFS